MAWPFYWSEQLEVAFLAIFAVGSRNMSKFHQSIRRLMSLFPNRKMRAETDVEKHKSFGL